MFLAKLSIKRPVLITMFLSVFIIFGALAYFSLSLNLMPGMDIPYVTIQTVYVGAGPLELETQITRKIEDAVSTVSGINTIQSYSMDNASFVVLEFEMSKDPDLASREVKEKVDAIINELPSDAEKPLVSKMDMSAFPIIDIVLTGTANPIELYDYADKKLRDLFSQIEGVAQVTMSGGQKREIKVLLDAASIEKYNISLAQLTGILAAQNLDMPGGQFQQQGQEFSVRLKGEIADLNALKNLQIPTPFGVMRLHEFAEIKDTGSEIREKTSYINNISDTASDDVINFSIIKSPEGNAVEISKQLKRLLPAIVAELPEGYHLNIVRDNSIFIESTVNDTLTNIILGILFTGFILFFFLNDLRSTFIVALAMPTSIISSFLLLQISGFSLNMMTLMGFSTAVGVLVTNSVVVIENIFRHKNMGNSRKEAADIGTSEITVAVIASTLTNIVVFLPIAMMTSMIGQVFREFALTVTFATLFSLLISFTLTPMLSSLILPHSNKKNKFATLFDNSFIKWQNLYQNSLKSVVKSKVRASALIGLVVLLFISSLFLAGKIGFDFMPTLDEGDINVEVELPEGYDINETAKLLSQIENIVKTHPEVAHILTKVGSMGRLNVGTNLAQISIKLVDIEDRETTTLAFIDRLAVELATVPNAVIRATAGSSVGGGDAEVEFYLTGQDSDVLKEIAPQIMNRLQNVDGLVNPNLSLRPGKPELTIVPKMDRLADAGVSVYDIALIMRASIEGLVATKLREEGNEYDIKVSLFKEDVNTPAKIANIPVVTPKGVFKMSQLVDLEVGEGTNMLMRQDKLSAIQFTGNSASDVPLGTVVGNVREALTEISLPLGYQIKWGGTSEMLDDTIKDMLRTFIIAVLLTYMLLAAILESFVQPLFILATLPFALIGVFFALYLTGFSMNIISMMAIIMLVGIVVNNAILLLDYTNQLVREGKPVKEALLDACPTKLKPIVMSSSAIILGMLPMALGMGAAGKEFRQPMGVVSIGGLIASTFLALYVIPSLYYLLIKGKKA